MNKKNTKEKKSDILPPYVDKVKKHMADIQMKRIDAYRILGVSNVTWFNIMNGEVPRFATVQKMTRLFPVAYEDFETAEGELTA